MTARSSSFATAAASAATLPSQQSPSGRAEPSAVAGSIGASPLGVAPPFWLADNCSQDVSAGMQAWLNALPQGSVVRAPAHSCYLIDGGLRLVGLQDVTIRGGDWQDRTVPVPGANVNDMDPAFWFVGGSGITVEDMEISGVNPGGYHESGAFGAGIRSDGVVGMVVANVLVAHVYGDGLSLNPLRASGDASSTIVRPSEDIIVHNIWIDGAGRQGVTLSDVTDAALSGLDLAHVALDVFDLEADQWNEGVQNVTIDGCTVGGDVGGLFFANAGEGSGGPWTSDVSVNGCTMNAPLAGDAILVEAADASGAPRGPITFDGDVLRCGASDYVACVEVTDGNVTVANSLLVCPPGTVHESVYDADANSTVNFYDDTVTGYGAAGSASPNSSATVLGGQWTSANGTSPGPVPLETSGGGGPREGAASGPAPSAPVTTPAAPASGAGSPPEPSTQSRSPGAPTSAPTTTTTTQPSLLGLLGLGSSG